MASTALMLSTVGLALAANYPQPFESAGTAAVVWGTNADSSDIAAAASIATGLQSALGDGGSTTTTTITGEAFPLFTSGTEIYLNDTLNVARTTVTDDNLPTILEDGDFSGNVDAEYTQTIVIPSNSRVLFGQQPSSNDDPTVFVNLGTSSTAIVYNTTITFDRAVNLTHADSEGEALNLFGTEWTIGADTDGDTIVLYQSSERIALSLGGSSPNPSATVEVEGNSYTIELVSASDSDATIRVTDSSGGTQSKEINEDDSKQINGIEVSVSYADESDATGTVSAEVTVGSQKIILETGQAVKVGSDEESLDGTLVSFNGGTVGAMTKLVIQTFSDDTDEDALITGGTFADPTWGSFIMQFTETSSDLDDEGRDMITVSANGDDEMKISFTDHRSDTNSFVWLNNQSQTMRLANSNDGKELLKVAEGTALNRSMFAVVGNQDEGTLVRLKTVSNSSGDTNDDIVFENVFDTSTTYKASITSEGAGTIDIGGQTFAVSYVGASTSPQDIVVRLNYPDTTDSGNIVLYPTIETDKGAKVSFYEPLTMNLTAGSTSATVGSVNAAMQNYTVVNSGTTNITGLLFPDGDNYNTATAVSYYLGGGVNANGNVTVGGVSLNATINSTQGPTSTTITSGRLTYNVTISGHNTVTVFLLDPVNGGNIVTPSVVIWEETEDRTDNEEALVVTLTGGGTSASETEVDTVVSTATTPGTTTGNGNSYTTLESNDDLSQILTLYGTLVTLDNPTSGQKSAKLSYPDDQVQAMVYFTEATASVGDGATNTGVVTIRDSEASTYSSRNMVVVGGSCVNTVAAQLLGSSCGSSFTSSTGAGSGEYIIETFTSPFSSSKVAVLVAGYNADDTENAATYLRTQTVDTTVGKKYKGTTGTQAILQTV
ncbi:MAG: hypothetical protein AABW79_04675 [Nanoarchaeota archaeon]